LNRRAALPLADQEPTTKLLGRCSRVRDQQRLGAVDKYLLDLALLDGGVGQVAWN